MRDEHKSMGLIQGKATKLYICSDIDGLKKLASTLTPVQADALRSHLKTVKQIRQTSRAAGKTQGEKIHD